MAAAAVAFLDSLDEAQSKKARFAFDDAERTNWHFVPNIYPGVPFSDLSSGQKRAVHRLLHTVLSGSGYHKTTTIMKLEDTLRDFAEAAGRKAPPGRVVGPREDEEGHRQGMTRALPEGDDR